MLSRVWAEVTETPPGGLALHCSASQVAMLYAWPAKTKVLLEHHSQSSEDCCLLRTASLRGGPMAHGAKSLDAAQLEHCKKQRAGICQPSKFGGRLPPRRISWNIFDDQASRGTDIGVSGSLCSSCHPSRPL